MKRIDDNFLQISQDEADRISEFIRYALDRQWDRHTDHVIRPGISWEDGMKEMNPEMYELSGKLQTIWTGMPEINGPEMMTQVNHIAKVELLLDTLETRNSDSLDFHTVSCGDAKVALTRAYSAGFNACYKQVTSEG